MPDTTPERPVIGVRVHFNDTRPPVLHTLGRSFNAHMDDGVLGIYDSRDGRLASHASMEWAWAELVHGEAEPELATQEPDDTIVTERVEAATRDLKAAQTRVDDAIRELYAARKAAEEWRTEINRRLAKGDE